MKLIVGNLFFNPDTLFGTLSENYGGKRLSFVVTPRTWGVIQDFRHVIYQTSEIVCYSCREIQIGGVGPIPLLCGDACSSQDQSPSWDRKISSWDVWKLWVP